MKKFMFALIGLSSFGASQAAFAGLKCAAEGSKYEVVMEGSKVTLFVRGKAFRTYLARGTDQYVAKADRGQEYTVVFEKQGGALVASVRFFGWGAPTNPNILACEETN